MALQEMLEAEMQGYRFPLELIRKMTPSLAHSTPSAPVGA
jgi:hypothetical protein